MVSHTITHSQVSNRLLQLGVGLGGLMAAVLFVVEPIWPRAFTQVSLWLAPCSGVAIMSQ